MDSESIRPIFSTDDAVICAKRAYNFDVLQVTELPGFEDRNFRLKTQSTSSARSTDAFYLMKISKCRTQEQEHSMLTSLRTMEQLGQQGFVCPRIIKSIDGDHIVKTEQKTTEEKEESRDQSQTYSIVRLMTFIPGSNLSDHLDDVNYTTISDIGELVAQIHLTLENMSDTINVIAREHDFWVMDNLSRSRDMLNEIEDHEKRLQMASVLDAFDDEVMTKYQDFSKGIIHGDITDDNLIVKNDDGRFVPLCRGYDVDEPRDDEEKSRQSANIDQANVKSKYGVIDFTDVTFSCHIFEVAMAIKDFIVDVPKLDAIRIAGFFLGGYLKHRQLKRLEIDVLYTCIKAGCYQYIVLGNHEYIRQPENKHSYLGSKEAWSCLQLLNSISQNEAIDIWRTILAEEFHIQI